MPYRNDVFHQGEYYHIYNRGAGQMEIFRSPEHRDLFLALLAAHCGEKQIGIVSYCLMTNHYHLLVTQEGDISISRALMSFTNSYAQRFNHDGNRRGVLFETRFKHKHVESDQYLLGLMRYIHANPVHALLVEDAAEWPYSDFRLWAGLKTPVRPENGRPPAGADNPLWSKERVASFRDALGISSPSDYAAEVREYAKVKIELDQFMKDLLVKRRPPFKPPDPPLGVRPPQTR